MNPSYDELQKFIETRKPDRESFLQVLKEVQQEHGYVPEFAIKIIADYASMDASSLASVVSFYSAFRFTPGGEHRVQVCIGTACHVKGAEDVIMKLREGLEIEEGSDSDAAMNYTIERVACLGCCSLAPAIKIDDTIIAYADRKSSDEIINEFKRKEGEAALIENERIEAEGSVSICLCSSCIAAGARAVYNELLEMRFEHSLSFNVNSMPCYGALEYAPFLRIDTAEGASLYSSVKGENVKAILRRHFSSKKIFGRLRELLHNVAQTFFYSGAEKADYALDELSPLLAKQQRMALETAGASLPVEEPDFSALQKVQSVLGAEVALELIEGAKMRGRGGAGYPTAKKWKAVKAAEAEKKYLVCNADEGDPGAFMDRLLIESFAAKLIEGMLIAMYVCGIYEGYIYIRSEYPIAVERMRESINMYGERGLLKAGGEQRSIKVIEGAGAFVCGEETALLRSIEGARPFPQARPPYPAESGLYGLPTLINNVETFALIPSIINMGAEHFLSIGSAESGGTKCFALAGKVERGGLVETGIGQSLNELVFDIGGGSAKPVKAVQIGGPSGGCLPAHLFDSALDYEPLKELGTIMGSGGVVVLDEDDCMPDLARYFAKFVMEESCGKCSACRDGSSVLYDMLNLICEGEAEEEDLRTLTNAASAMKGLSLCGLGKTAANPVLSTLNYFYDEYLAHINGFCPAGKCKGLISYEINGDCTGCGICARGCEFGAIAGVIYGQHTIDQSQCVKCAECYNGCPYGAVEKKGGRGA